MSLRKKTHVIETSASKQQIGIMKLLPVTLTLFDKATNNTYKGTLLLKNLNIAEENSTAAGDSGEESDYDGQGAGLFIILVVSVYALSIVLFIASFITKKANLGENLEENTVNTYLHKVGDLKEKTAREHFKKLKMSIISKVEMDSQKERRGKKEGRVKDLAGISRASSKTSLGACSDRQRTSSFGAAAAVAAVAAAAAVLPREDDPTQPLLSASDGTTPSPPTAGVHHGRLSPNFEAFAGQQQRGRLSPCFDGRGQQQRSSSPGLRRSTDGSCRSLSVIREMPDTDGAEVETSSPSVPEEEAKKQQQLTVTATEPPPRIVVVGSSSKDELPISKSTEDITDATPHVFKPIDVPKSSNSTPAGLSDLPMTCNAELPVVIVNVTDNDDPEPIRMVSVERPRPRHAAVLSREHAPSPASSISSAGSGEVWQQQQQKGPGVILPPPESRSSRKPPNLRLQIPQYRPGHHRDEVWVLRNGKDPLQEEGPTEGPSDDARERLRRGSSGGGRQSQPQQSMENSKRERSPRSRSPRSRSPRGRSPPRSQPDAFFYPHDARTLPLPFRTPSPRSPPRSPIEYFPPQTRVIVKREEAGKPETAGSVASSAEHRAPIWTPGSKDKATLKVTFDRSPEVEAFDESHPLGWSNMAYEQSPRAVGDASHRGRTPPRVNFNIDAAGSSAHLLHVQQHQFPVTFNSPSPVRRSESMEKVRSSDV